jgi:hypothetical protein
MKSLGKGGDGTGGKTTERYCTWDLKANTRTHVQSKGAGSQKPTKRKTNGAFRIIGKNACDVNWCCSFRPTVLKAAKKCDSLHGELASEYTARFG